jgi:hypothetical protein
VWWVLLLLAASDLKTKSNREIKNTLSDEKFCFTLFFFWALQCHRHYQSLSVLLVSFSNSNQDKFGTKTKISTSFFSFLEWVGTQQLTQDKKKSGEKKKQEPNALVSIIRKKKAFLICTSKVKTKEVLENKLLVAWIDKLKKKQL